MDRNLQTVSVSGQRLPLPQAGGTLAREKNTVLRNTYWLLALTMLPTIGGALVGMQMNLARLFVTNPIMAPLIMFGVMMGGLFVVSALRNSAWGVAALFGFTFVAGVALTPILTYAAGFSNDVTICHRMIQGLDAGSVLINDSTDYRLDSMPFGGIKSSGLGREGIRFSLAEMTEPKVVCWYLPGLRPE